MSDVKNTVSQYRFNGSGCLGTKLKGKGSYYALDEYKELAFQFPGETEFSVDYDYRFTLKIRRDVSSDIDINLTLRRASTNKFDDDKSYQYLDTVHLPKWIANDNGEDFIVPTRCALYATNLVAQKEGESSFAKWGREDLKVSEVLEWPKSGSAYIKEIDSSTNQLNSQFIDKQLYFKESNGVVTYYLCRRSIAQGEVTSADYSGVHQTLKVGMNEWKPLSSTLISPSWRATYTDDAYSVFDITFRPLVGGFDRVCAEIERKGIDGQVFFFYQENGQSVSYPGRKLDLTGGGATLQRVNDLVPAMKKNANVSSITRIGVWGRPGLLMCLNGEPIHVGHSSFYEQDSVEVETLGVVAQDQDWSSVFTIDYMGPANGEAGA